MAELMVRLDMVMVLKLRKIKEIDRNMEIDKRQNFELLEFPLSFSFLSCTKLVYARARNITASSGTGRREVSVRTLGKRGILPMRMMYWTVANENNKKNMPRTKLMMMISNILMTLVFLMRTSNMVDRRKVTGVEIRMIRILSSILVM